MTRNIGLVEAIQEELPRTALEVFTVLTQLGDVWFFFVTVALLYWFRDRGFGDRAQGAFVLGTTLGALALTLALKGSFALPRPPETLQYGHATGYGFPSGHALATTVVWGLFARTLDVSTHHRRVAVASGVIALVSASRVAIGVHYAADVIAGVGLGLAYLAVAFRIGDWRPERAFGGAALIAVAAIVTTGGGTDAVATLGGALGAGAAWCALDVPPPESVGLPTAVAALGVLGGLAYAGTEMGLPLPAVFVVNGLIPAAILSMPTVATQLKSAAGRERPRVS